MAHAFTKEDELKLIIQIPAHPYKALHNIIWVFIYFIIIIGIIAGFNLSTYH